MEMSEAETRHDRRRPGFLILGLAIVAATLFLGILPAASAQAATASCFGFDWTLDGTDSIKTYQAAQRAEFYLDQIGYSASAYNNNSGWAAYNNLPNPAVWYFAYHAGPHFIASARPYNGQLVSQYICAEPYLENSAGDPYLDQARYYLNKQPRVDISQVMLAMFLGCHTSQYKLYHYPDQKYNLCHVLTAEKGVDTAIGFYETISVADWNGASNPTYLWTNLFFERLSSSYSVSSAQTYAIAGYYAVWGDYGGYDSAQIFGNTSLVLTPARNGAED